LSEAESEEQAGVKMVKVAKKQKTKEKKKGAFFS
jgi:hypothetical protein